MTLKEFQKLQALVLSCLNEPCRDIDFGVNEHAYELLVAAGGTVRRIAHHGSPDKVISVVRVVIGGVALEAQINAPITDEDRAKEAEELARTRDYSEQRLRELEARIAAAK